MTYDPDRDMRAPDAVNPNTQPRERDGPRFSVLLMLGLMVAFIAVGLWFYATSGNPITTEDRTDPRLERTTGTGSQERPLPSTPTPPTVPSPPRE